MTASSSRMMDNFSILRKLGGGAQSSVYLAEHIPSQLIVALKKMKPENTADQERSTGRYEAAILRAVESPHVVKVVDVLERIRGPKRHILIILEALDCDMRRFMDSEFGSRTALPPRLAKHFCLQMLLGLKHCHSRGVVHRDLKPRNLLVHMQTHTVKLADFGFASMSARPVLLSDDFVGTRWYAAPEMLLGTREYTAAVDMWSAGCVLAFMLRGDALFKGVNGDDQLVQIFDLRGTPTRGHWPAARALPGWRRFQRRFPIPVADIAGWPEGIEREALDLVDGLLQLDPSKRVSATEALNSTYFDSIRAEHREVPSQQQGETTPSAM